MSTDNGGPAFPTTKRFTEKYADDAGYARTREVSNIVGGMTLRDYFAAKAMQALIIKGEFVVGMGEPSKYNQAASHAKKYADLLIMELKK